jgi:hypothetical protein
MDVDEAGDHIASPEIDFRFSRRFLRRGEAAVPHGKASVFEAPVFGIHIRVFIDHVSSLRQPGRRHALPRAPRFFIRQHDTEPSKEHRIILPQGTLLPAKEMIPEREPICQPPRRDKTRIKTRDQGKKLTSILLISIAFEVYSK